MQPVRILAPAPPLGTDGPALARILQLSGLNKASTIRLTGPCGVEAALWLCRHGFERAAYVHANWVGAMRSADALVVADPVSEAALEELLGGGDCLRLGGVVIAQVAQGVDEAAHDHLQLALEALGYRLERRIAERGREILIARRLASPGWKHAA